MSLKIDEKILREVDELAVSTEKLSRDAASSKNSLGPERVEELASLTSRVGQIIHHLYGDNSQYRQNLTKVLSTINFHSMHSHYFMHISEFAGIVKGIQHDIKVGLLNDFRMLLQAEIFADFLEMAEYLLGEGYKDAAAVILGSVMEDSLKKLAVSRGLKTTSSNGKPLTIDPLNIELAKDNAYSPLIQKQITTWANLRNDAAHGNYSEYDKDQVKQMLLFVQKFCLDYLQ